MKRIFIIFVVLLLAIPNAFAEKYPVCDCNSKQCTCFIQLGDEGPIVNAIIKLLIAQEYCAPDQKVSILDEGARKGILRFQKEHDLQETGTLDDNTLTLLIWGCLPEELNEMDPNSRYDYNWVPTDGGRRRHRNERCSSMYDPRKISVRNAEALGYKNCGKCNKLDKPID